MGTQTHTTHMKKAGITRRPKERMAKQSFKVTERWRQPLWKTLIVAIALHLTWTYALGDAQRGNTE